jgi:LPXTG-site transpeptidase (sortase) family protein
MDQVTIYSAQEPSKKDKKRRRKKRRLGRWLVFIGLAVALILVSPILFMEARYGLSQLARKKPEEVSGFGKIIKSIEEETGFAKVIRETDLALLKPADPNFSVVISKIQVNSRVFANIPTDDKKVWEPILQKGVAHAKGSFLPGEQKTVYLFGHSTDYIWNVRRFNAVFYLLKELEEGDRVSVFYQGVRFEYEVMERKVVNADQLEEINKDLEQDRLILQTCWPPGTTWRRLLVFAKPV